MGTQAALVTVEEFLRLPAKDGVKQELIEGVVYQVGNPRGIHELVKAWTTGQFWRYSFLHPEWVPCSESMFLDDEDTAMIPDAALVRREALLGSDLEKRFAFAPAVTVEVVSSETAEELDGKIRFALRWGVQAVLVIYPRAKEIHLRRQGAQPLILTVADTLELPGILPDFSVPVASFFEGLEP